MFIGPIIILFLLLLNVIVFYLNGEGCCVLGPRLPLGKALERLTIGLETTSRVGEIKPSSKVESVVIFHYLPTRSVTALMGLSYVGPDASQLSLPVLVVRAYGRRVVSRVKRSASMVCHALGVSLWGLGVPFVDCTGVRHSYCMLLWYLLCYGTSRLQQRFWLLA